MLDLLSDLNNSFFLVFKHDFIRHADFTRISASNTASDDVTNKVTHRIFNTDLLYSGTHFLVEIDEKSSHNGGFQYDLMTTSDSGLLFGPPCICATGETIPGSGREMAR